MVLRRGFNSYDWYGCEKRLVQLGQQFNISSQSRPQNSEEIPLPQDKYFTVPIYLRKNINIGLLIIRSLLFGQRNFCAG